MAPNTWLNDLLVTGAELTALAVVFLVLTFIINRVVRLVVDRPTLKQFGDGQRTRRAVRRWALISFLLGAASIIGFNAYLIAQRQPVWETTINLINSSLPISFWQQFGIALLQIGALLIGARILLRLLKQWLPDVQNRVQNIALLSASADQIQTFFSTLSGILRRGIWLSVIGWSAFLIGLPPIVGETIFVVLNIYLIIALGRLIVSIVGTAINTLDILSERYLNSELLDEFYQQLRSLIPLLSRTLEYIIYVQAASLAVAQIGLLADLAQYGAIIIQLIGIIFISRVLVEIINLLIDRFVLVRGDLNDSQWQQRQTFGPVLKSALRYAIFSGAGIMMLGAVGVDVGPVLVALGGLGLVLGLAAQPVLTDLISGLFILFENLFLVGDYIETGTARGVVESIDIRTTRIRSPDGQLHLVRNGQIGDIVNYSKGYVYAVVLINIAYEVDLDRAFEIIRTTGKELDQTYSDVLEPTIVQGVETFSDDAIVIRTITRVKPGRHEQMARELRNLIRKTFEREDIAMGSDATIQLKPSVLLSSQALGQ
jgi:small conductance mechanosensitive channel